MSSNLLTMREMQMKTKKNFHLSTIKTGKMLYLMTNSAGRSVRKQADGNSIGYNT